MSSRRIMDIGELSHRLVLQRPVLTCDLLGGQDKTWCAVQTLWAKVSVRSQRESQKGDQLLAKITYDVVIRYRDDIVPGMRLLHRSKILSILSCADLSGTRRFSTCLCEEIK